MEQLTVSQDELFKTVKALEREILFLRTQEQYIKNEYAALKKAHEYAKNKINEIKSVPLAIGQFSEMIDEDYAIISNADEVESLVRVMSTVPREELKPGASVLLHKGSSSVVGVLPSQSDSTIRIVSNKDKPSITFEDIGGLDLQKQEIREAVELPLTHPELYDQIGIDAPRGVLLYGPPGTGKTMLARAVAATTKANFIQVVGSEFVQKYLGEGPRMVREVFRLAREHAPSIIFIDEIDSVATKRFDSKSGGDREVQRVLIELLTQLDGFNNNNDAVRVIMATNRADTIDPALMRPGRLDRKIEFPLPDRRQKRLIFQTITSKMQLDKGVDLEAFITLPDKLSGADISSVCLEAGMCAVRENRYVVTQEDFEKGYKEAIKKRAEQQNLFYQ